MELGQIVFGHRVHEQRGLAGAQISKISLTDWHLLDLGGSTPTLTHPPVTDRT